MTNFTPEQKTIGHVVTLSGSIVIADGIHADNLPGGDSQKVLVDLGQEDIRIPVMATRQNGRRFLLIPIDAAQALPKPASTTVNVTDPVPLPDPKEKKASDEPQSK